MNSCPTTSTQASFFFKPNRKRGKRPVSDRKEKYFFCPICQTHTPKQELDFLVYNDPSTPNNEPFWDCTWMNYKPHMSKSQDNMGYQSSQSRFVPSTSKHDFVQFNSKYDFASSASKHDFIPSTSKHNFVPSTSMPDLFPASSKHDSYYNKSENRIDGSGTSKPREYNRKFSESHVSLWDDEYEVNSSFLDGSSISRNSSYLSGGNSTPFLNSSDLASFNNGSNNIKNESLLDFPSFSRSYSPQYTFCYKCNRPF